MEKGSSTAWFSPLGDTNIPRGVEKDAGAGGNRNVVIGVFEPNVDGFCAIGWRGGKRNRGSKFLFRFHFNPPRHGPAWGHGVFRDEIGGHSAIHVFS